MPLPTDTFFLSADAASAFGRGVRLERVADRGALERLARGVYLDADVWAAKDHTARYRARVAAFARRRRSGAVVSHQSAAAFYGLPSLFPWPREVHLTVDRRSSMRSTDDVRVHRTHIDEGDIVERDGLYFTNLARTLIDVAATTDIKSGVGMIDRALAVDRYDRTPPMVTKAELRDTLARALPLRGSVRAASVIDFATDLSGSIAESASRVNIALAGFPQPQLQRTFVVEGIEYDSDFYFPSIDGIGECDGKQKYFAQHMTSGRTPEEVFWNEKQREDRLRTKVRSFTRWDFSVGVNMHRLAARLRDAGLQQSRTRALGWDLPD